MARSRALLALVLTACVLGGCGGAGMPGLEALRGPRTWIYNAEQPDGDRYSVSLTDRTGRIDAAELDPPGVPAPVGASNPAGEPDVVLVGWVGGACDLRTSITIDVATAGDGLVVRIRSQVEDRPCDAIGISHVLRLDASGPLPAASVEVSAGS